MSQSSIDNSSVISAWWAGQFIPAMEAVLTTAPPAGILGSRASVRRISPSVLTFITSSGEKVAAIPALLNSTCTGASMAAAASSTATGSPMLVGM